MNKLGILISHSWFFENMKLDYGTARILLVLYTCFPSNYF